MTTYRKYIWAFLITLVVFLTITVISNYFDTKRINEISTIENNISLDILSSETQFDLLKETSCEDLGNSSLSQELGSLGSRLSFLENTRGVSDPEVIRLKQDYSLLEIKDYILMQTMSQKCGFKPVFVIYFYSNKGDCPDCENAGIVLTALYEKYPELRVYSFDYNIGVSAVTTLENVYNVKAEFPAFVIHGKPVYGLKTLDQMEQLMPELASMASSTNVTSTATTTIKNSKE